MIVNLNKTISELLTYLIVDTDLGGAWKRLNEFSRVMEIALNRCLFLLSLMKGVYFCVVLITVYFVFRIWLVSLLPNHIIL